MRNLESVQQGGGAPAPVEVLDKKPQQEVEPNPAATAKYLEKMRGFIDEVALARVQVSGKQHSGLVTPEMQIQLNRADSALMDATFKYVGLLPTPDLERIQRELTMHIDRYEDAAKEEHDDSSVSHQKEEAHRTLRHAASIELKSRREN